MSEQAPRIPVRHAARFGWPLPPLAGADDADEQDTPTTDDTPIDGTVTTDQQAEQQNWEDRYKEAQAWGTRVAQEKAQLEQQAQLVQALQSDDPALRKQAFEALGLELADETDDTQYADPSEQLAARLETLEQQLAQQNQQAQQAQQIALIEQHVEQQLETLNGLDDSDREWIVNTAVAMPPTPDGMPDIKGAYDKFAAWETERQKKWVQSKRAHPFSPGGKEGTQQPDLGTRQGKVDYVLGRLQADET